MPIKGAYGLVVTVRDDGPTKTIIVQDQDANVLGELTLDPVPVGFRVNADNADGSSAGQLVVRA